MELDRGVARRSYSRRDLLELAAKSGLVLGGAALLGGAFELQAAAQDSTPESAFPPADLPVIDIAIGADGTVTVPAESAAGTTTVRVTAAEGVGYVSTVMLIKPDDISMEEFEAALIAPDIPDWLATTHVTGSIDYSPADEGNEKVMVTDLVAGTWYVVSFGETPVYTTIEVSGDPVIVELDYAVDVVMEHHDFTLPSEVPSGPQVWRVTNADAVLHHMVIFQTNRLLSDEEVLSAMMAAESGATPMAGEEDVMIMPAGGIGILSQGEILYQEMNLAPGTYSGLCFLTDPGMSEPHVVLGMIESFTAV